MSIKTGTEIKPTITRKDILELAKLVTFYHISLDNLDKYDPTARNRARTYWAKNEDQEEFIMVQFDKGLSLKQIGDVADKIHAIRNKNDIASHPKVLSLQERGYMIIREPEVVDALTRLVPDQIRSFVPPVQSYGIS